MDILFDKTQETWNYLAYAICMNKLLVKDLKWFENIKVDKELKIMQISNEIINDVLNTINESKRIAKVMSDVVFHVFYRKT